MPCHYLFRLQGSEDYFSLWLFLVKFIYFVAFLEYMNFIVCWFWFVYHRFKCWLKVQVLCPAVDKQYLRISSTKNYNKDQSPREHQCTECVTLRSLEFVLIDCSRRPSRKLLPILSLCTVPLHCHSMPASMSTRIKSTLKKRVAEEWVFVQQLTLDCLFNKCFSFAIIVCCWWGAFLPIITNWQANLKTLRNFLLLCKK